MNYLPIDQLTGEDKNTRIKGILLRLWKGKKLPPQITDAEKIAIARAFEKTLDATDAIPARVMQLRVDLSSTLSPNLLELVCANATLAFQPIEANDPLVGEFTDAMLAAHEQIQVEGQALEAYKRYTISSNQLLQKYSHLGIQGVLSYYEYKDIEHILINCLKKARSLPAILPPKDLIEPDLKMLYLNFGVSALECEALTKVFESEDNELKTEANANYEAVLQFPHHELLPYKFADVMIKQMVSQLLDDEMGRRLLALNHEPFSPFGLVCIGARLTSFEDLKSRWISILYETFKSVIPDDFLEQYPIESEFTARYKEAYLARMEREGTPEGKLMDADEAAKFVFHGEKYMAALDACHLRLTNPTAPGPSAAQLLLIIYVRQSHAQIFIQRHREDFDSLFAQAGLPESVFIEHLFRVNSTKFFNELIPLVPNQNAQASNAVRSVVSFSGAGSASSASSSNRNDREDDNDHGLRVSNGNK